MTRTLQDLLAVGVLTLGCSFGGNLHADDEKPAEEKTRLRIRIPRITQLDIRTESLNGKGEVIEAKGDIYSLNLGRLLSLKTYEDSSAHEIMTAYSFSPIGYLLRKSILKIGSYTEFQGGIGLKVGVRFSEDK